MRTLEYLILTAVACAFAYLVIVPIATATSNAMKAGTEIVERY